MIRIHTFSKGSIPDSYINLNEFDSSSSSHFHYVTKEDHTYGRFHAAIIFNPLRKYVSITEQYREKSNIFVTTFYTNGPESFDPEVEKEFFKLELPGAQFGSTSTKNIYGIVYDNISPIRSELLKYDATISIFDDRILIRLQYIPTTPEHKDLENFNITCAITNKGINPTVFQKRLKEMIKKLSNINIFLHNNSKKVLNVLQIYKVFRQYGLNINPTIAMSKFPNFRLFINHEGWEAFKSAMYKKKEYIQEIFEESSKFDISELLGKKKGEGVATGTNYVDVKVCGIRILTDSRNDITRMYIPGGNGSTFIRQETFKIIDPEENEFYQQLEQRSEGRTCVYSIKIDGEQKLINWVWNTNIIMLYLIATGQIKIFHDSIEHQKLLRS